MTYDRRTVDDLNRKDGVQVACRKLGLVNAQRVSGRLDGSGFDARGGRDVHAADDIRDLLHEPRRVRHDLRDIAHAARAHSLRLQRILEDLNRSINAWNLEERIVPLT